MNGPRNGPRNRPGILDRRQVLAGGGALIVSFSLTDAFAQDQAAPAAAHPPKWIGSLKETPFLDSWVRIDADGSILTNHHVIEPWWNNDELKLTVRRALEHYETNRKSYELELTNQRLAARLIEIQQLATIDYAHQFALEP